MNYLPYSGWWFYGAASATERANFFASWGLYGTAGAPPVEYFYGIPTIASIPTVPSVVRVLVGVALLLMMIGSM